jgi:hypothetical protein
MALEREQYVQVAPDSTGKKVRNCEITAIQQDGSIATVEMQVISIARTDGTPVDLDGRWDELIALVRTTNRLLASGFNIDISEYEE